MLYYSLGQYQQAIEFHQQALNIAREFGDRFCEGTALDGIGLTHQSLGQYQRSIEFHQQALNIAREIGARFGEGSTWFNLGLSLENINRELDALEAYRNACELYQAMGLNAKVQDCNNAIERLSQQDAPVASKQGFWGWPGNLWCWLKKLWRRLRV